MTINIIIVLENYTKINTKTKNIKKNNTKANFKYI